MNLWPYAPEIITALSSVLAVILLHLRANRKRQDTEKNILQKLAEKTEDLEKKLDSKIKKANGVPWAFIDNLPLPAWAKDLNGKMIWINTEYSLRFDIKPSEYEGRDDYEVWPLPIAEKFRRNDLNVIKSGLTTRFQEDVPDSWNDPNAAITSWTVWKFPIFDNNGIIAAVGGIAAPASFENR